MLAFHEKRLQNQRATQKQGFVDVPENHSVDLFAIFCSCHYSGHLVEKPDTAAIAEQSQIAQTRRYGTMPTPIRAEATRSAK